MHNRLPVKVLAVMVKRIQHLFWITCAGYRIKDKEWPGKLFRFVSRVNFNVPSRFGLQPKSILWRRFKYQPLAFLSVKLQLVGDNLVLVNHTKQSGISFLCDLICSATIHLTQHGYHKDIELIPAASVVS